MSPRIGYAISAGLALAGIAALFTLTASSSGVEGLSLWVPSTSLVAGLAVALLVRVLVSRPLRVLVGLGAVGLCVSLVSFGGIYLLPAALALLVVAALTKVSPPGRKPPAPTQSRDTPVSGSI